MDAPALPPQQYLTLREAIALVCPPLLEQDVRRAIEEALCDGHLVETPRPLAVKEAATELEATMELEFARVHPWARLPLPPASPEKWQSRFRAGRVDWETGEIEIPIPKERVDRRTGERENWIETRRETPVFRREDVEALFEAKAAAAPRGHKTATQLPEVIDVLKKNWPRGVGAPNRKALKEAVDKRLGRPASFSTIDRARKIAWP